MSTYAQDLNAAVTRHRGWFVTPSMSGIASAERHSGAYVAHVSADEHYLGWSWSVTRDGESMRSGATVGCDNVDAVIANMKAAENAIVAMNADVDLNRVLNRAKAYLQGPNGDEVELTVTEPDERDGSVCAHLPDDRWVRFVPNS